MYTFIEHGKNINFYHDSKTNKMDFLVSIYGKEV